MDKQGINQNLSFLNNLDGGLPSDNLTNSISGADGDSSFIGNVIFTLIKFAIWGLISYLVFFVQDDAEISTLPEKLGSLFIGCWIVGLICPNAVIRFGLPSDRSTVSKIYTTLIALTFGSNIQLLQENFFGINLFNWYKEDFYFNNIQIRILFIASSLAALAIIYPEGTIFGNEESKELGRLGLAFMYYFLALIIIGSIGIVRLVF
ncbi:hypothetical protein NG799_25835 [Laspinema sp. D1]|uniref:Uncharacterized protein n=1 Tax=Laspinema palackyanum D2a TaxID=2953684 RepID=A0ABT2MYH8_9CYAN|nr:hypothetical protein [Laspinema sp. D2a]